MTLRDLKRRHRTAAPRRRARDRVIGSGTSARAEMCRQVGRLIAELGRPADRRRRRHHGGTSPRSSWRSTAALPSSSTAGRHRRGVEHTGEIERVRAFLLAEFSTP